MKQFFLVMIYRYMMGLIILFFYACAIFPEFLFPNTNPDTQLMWVTAITFSVMWVFVNALVIPSLLKDD